MSQPKQTTIGEIKAESQKTLGWLSKKYFLLALSFLLIFIVIFYDISYNEIPNPSESPGHPISNFLKNAASKLTVDSVPDFNGLHIIRMALLIVSSFLIVLFLIQFYPKKIDGSTSNLKEVNEVAIQSIIPPWVQNFIIRISLLTSIAFVSLFLIKVRKFYGISREGSLVDSLSALFLFINFGLFVYIFVLLNRKLKRNKKLYLLIPLAFAFFFFLSGMEEISWGQSIFHWKTPEEFEGNIQHETNLHNFFTDPLEVAYYFGSFFFLIFIPFVNERTSVLSNKKILSLLTPNRFILFSSVIFVAYNYEMWNEFLTQLSFFITLFILVYYLLLYIRTGKNIFNITSILIIFIVTQILFIAFGYRLVRLWDISEYKEFFIPLSFLVYSIEVLLKVRKQFAIN